MAVAVLHDIRASDPMEGGEYKEISRNNPAMHIIDAFPTNALSPARLLLNNLIVRLK